MQHGEAHGIGPAHRVAGEDEAVEFQRIGEGEDVAGEGICVVAARRRAGQSVAALVEADEAKAALEALDPRLPGVKVCVRAMKEYDHGCIVRAFVAVMHRGAAG